ncbi:MAG: CBS domain-containing protein [bacterium]|nr:CBS domain-containing protein [bacterium]
MLKIRSVLESKGREVTSIDGDVPVSEAIAAMSSKNIGAIVVKGKPYPQGIITERDVLQLWQHKERVQSRPVQQVMSRKLVVTKIDDSLTDALTVMIQKHIRHLLVTDGSEVVGILSIRDLVKERIKHNEASVRYMEDVLSSDMSREW